MKVIGYFFKIYFTLCLMVIPSHSVFAQDFTLYEKSFILLEEKTPELELALFKEQKEPWRAVRLNFIPFGLGSFQQGDFTGGAVIAVLDGLSALILFGELGGRTQGIDRPNRGSTGIASIMGIILFWGFGRLVGIIAPHMHYDSALKEFMRDRDKEVILSETVPLLQFTYSF